MKSISAHAGLAATAFVFAVLAPGTALPQQTGKATVTVHIDNDRVRVNETHYRPGDVVEFEDRSMFRVQRILQGGTLERTYPDGKKETMELKAGDVRYQEPSKGGNYTTRNVGKTDIVVYVVRLK